MVSKGSRLLIVADNEDSETLVVWLTLLQVRRRLFPNGRVWSEVLESLLSRGKMFFIHARILSEEDWIGSKATFEYIYIT